MNGKLAGASWYITGKKETVVYFPDGDISCQWCPFCRYRSLGKKQRYICIETYEEIGDPSAEIGRDCPLEIEREKGR